MSEGVATVGLVKQAASDTAVLSTTSIRGTGHRQMTCTDGRPFLTVGTPRGSRLHGNT